MDTEVDLTTVDRAVLIAIIAELQAVIERLQRRIAELEGQTKPGDPLRMPGLKAKSARKPPAQQQPRKQRPARLRPPAYDTDPSGGARDENCPDCGAHLSGGWTQRTRKSSSCRWFGASHRAVYLARTCPACRRRCTPPAVLDGVVLGQQRLGVNLLSLIATLREEGRLPIRSVQWYLDTVHQLRLSVGAIVSAIHQTAQRAQPAVAAILDRIRASPWSTPTKPAGARTGPMATCDFQHPHRTLLPAAGSGQGGGGRSAGRVVLRSAGQRFLRCYHHYDGPSSAAGPTCCGTSTTSAPATPKTPHWPDGPRQSTSSMSQPKPATITSHGKGWLPNWPGSGSCWPSAALSWLTRRRSKGKLCRRIERHIKELFVFVAEPEVPADNNPAERSLRHLVISRKVSGGTRSEQGTESKMTLASIFGTWRAQGLNPLAACRQLLVSPRL